MNKHIHEPDLKLEIWVEFLDSQYVRSFAPSFNRDFYVILTINLFWRVFQSVILIIKKFLLLNFSTNFSLVCLYVLTDETI
jgi:hypothetical protein